MNGTGPAKSGAAAELRTCHLQLLAYDPEEWRIVRRCDGQSPPVDIETRHRFLPLPVMKTAYGGTHFFCWVAPTGMVPKQTMLAIRAGGNENRAPVKLCVAAAML